MNTLKLILRRRKSLLSSYFDTDLTIFSLHDFKRRVERFQANNYPKLLLTRHKSFKLELLLSCNQKIIWRNYRRHCGVIGVSTSRRANADAKSALSPARYTRLPVCLFLAAACVCFPSSWRAYVRTRASTSQHMSGDLIPTEALGNAFHFIFGSRGAGYFDYACRGTFWKPKPASKS